MCTSGLLEAPRHGDGLHASRTGSAKWLGSGCRLAAICSLVDVCIREGLFTGSSVCTDVDVCMEDEGVCTGRVGLCTAGVGVFGGY